MVTTSRIVRNLKNLLINLLIVQAIAMPVLTALPIQKAYAAPPEDFQSTPLITSGLEGPSGFEIAPDGRIFILERTGTIKVYKNGQLLPTPFAELPSIAAGDRGLIGIAFDPDFAVNCYVYFYYTSASDLLNRLVRFNACGDVGTDGPFLIYQTNSPSQELHVGGSIRFGADGKMYFAVGDNGYPPNGQDLSNPHGKILRINKDGTIPEDNPFYGQPGLLGEIYAYGFRNPWRFQFDSVTNQLYGGDVGDYSWEEVNHIVKGGNYGWPLREGYCGNDCAGTIAPIYAYPHAGFSAAVTGGPVYRSDMFPEEYQGDLFFADYAQGFIKHMDLDAQGNNLGVHSFDDVAGSVVDLKIAGDGAMYYLTYYPGRLYKVTYNSGNTVPTAVASSNVTKGQDPLTVQFSSAGSSDPDGTPLTYLWNFDDGTTSTLANPTKTFTQKGTYTVELTVSDGENFAQAVPVVIQVGIPPTVRISVPQDGYVYNAGQQVTYNAFANDAAGFDLNDAQISTDVIFHHDTHTHPFLDNLIGRANTFTIPDTGEAAANTWYRIVTTATDANGLTATDEINIYPEVVQMTYASDKAGVGVNVDGVPYPSPHTVNAVVGFKREVSATPIVQGSNGTYYQFENWSDGGSIRHLVTTPEQNTTVTARYTPAPSFNAQYFNNTDLAGAPVLTRQEAIINNDWGFGSPAAGVAADQWSARYTKNQFFAEGRYKFTTATDDGVRLYIDGELVIDKWFGQNLAHTATVDLTQGMHEIRMEYFEAFGGAYARLNWDTTPDQPVVVEKPYAAQYFNNATLTGTPVLQRTEADVNYEWGAGAPDPSLPVDFFSARWNRTVQLEAGVYKFTVTADDGVRLFVDNQPVINQWIDQAPTTYTADVQLAAGNHTLRLEYYEKAGGATAKMAFEKVGDVEPTAEYHAHYWNLTPGAAPVIPASAPQAHHHETTLNHDWGAGSPDPAITPDYFVAQWEKNDTFQAGTYEFAVTADDGVRLFVDDELILDQWVDQPPTTYTVTKALTAGAHEIRMEYYEKAGGAVAKLDYGLTDVTVPPSTTFLARYWNTPGAGTAPAIPVGQPQVTRNEATINHEWAGGSPDAAISADHFVGRWVKNHNFTAGTYKFSTVSDDGVRVYLDNQLVIDQWNDHAPTAHSNNIAVTTGEHEIKVEFYENAGGATMQFNFEQVTGGTGPSATYTASYWNTPGAGGEPAVPIRTADLTRQEAAITNNWGAGSPDASIATDHFIARWVRQSEFAAGTYRLTTQSDDGIRVYIDNVLVLNQWNDHAPTTHTVDVPITAGLHEVRVEFYENSGGAVCTVNLARLP